LESTSQGLFKYGINFELIIFSILIILEKRKEKENQISAACAEFELAVGAL
jgi:hypothetical protein